MVLDTNALLVAIPTKSIYRPIFDALTNGDFELILSNEILTEYVEIIERKANSSVANNIAEMLLNLKTLQKVEVDFEWTLIEHNPDDHKYVDAAIAGAANLIVSNDQHFYILSTVMFPKIKVIGIADFLSLIGGK